MIKAVVYDMDGMVLGGGRFSDAYAKEFGITFADMQPFFDESFPKCILGQADLKEELAHWLSKWRWKGTVEELLEYWLHRGDEIDTAVLNSVDTLRAKGMLCVLATNQEKYRGEYVKKELKLAEHFEKIFVSNEIGYKKPEPQFFEAIMEFLRERDSSMQKSEVLFWDDREAFVEGAKRFGFEARFYTGFLEYEKEMKNLKLL